VKINLSHGGRNRLRVFENRVLRVFENRVLTRIFGPVSVEVTGLWIKLFNEELRNLTSPNIIRLSRSRRLRCLQNFRDLKGKDHLGRSGITGKIILKLIFKK
jgi:hypothetical protein